MRTGTIIGNQISEVIRHVESKGIVWFPLCSALYDLFLFPSISRASTFQLTEAQEAHIGAFYLQNKDSIDERLSNCLTGPYNTHKTDFVTCFKDIESEKGIELCFGSETEIDRGTFRCIGVSPVDYSRFVASVRKAFRLIDVRVTLTKLAYSCYLCIR